MDYWNLWFGATVALIISIIKVLVQLWLFITFIKLWKTAKIIEDKVDDVYKKLHELQNQQQFMLTTFITANKK